MGVADMKKGARELTPKVERATSKEADQFVSGAKVDGAATTRAAAREKVYKRITFSLTEEIDQQIDRLSLVPRDFRASRSDVIRAAVALLAGQSEADIVRLMKENQLK